MKKGLNEAQFSWLVISPAILIVFGMVLYPLVETFIYSLKNMDLTSSNMGQFVWLSNYYNMLLDPGFWQSVEKTVYYSVVSISVEIVLGLFIALLLNENIRGISFLRTIIILPWAVPTIVNGAMWKWIYHSEYGALNALLTQLGVIHHYHSWLGSPWLAMNMVIIADIWKTTPFVAIFFLASLQLSNRSIYEAALVDGAGIFKRFFVLTLNHLKATFLVLVVMRTMDAFKVFDIIYIITQGGPANGTMVLTYSAYLKTFTNLEYSKGATISYLIAIMITILTLSYIKISKKGEAK